MQDLLLRPALELAALVRTGEVSARELTAAALERIEEANVTYGSFVHVAAEEALAAAERVGPGDERPFAGVPTAIKDNRHVEGWPLTFGAEMLRDNIAREDAFLVRRLRDAGFVLLGKTALPEFGILPTTETTAFGPCRNPWDTERTPGGSSGGSASAVASGMVPVAHGNDGGGSTRIPAACCGLVGLKPTRNRISSGPHLGDSLLVADGMLTRTVADTAALLDVLAGYEPGDANWVADPAAPFAELAERDPGRLRIAMTTKSPLPGVELHPECERAYAEAADLLADLGHEVEEVDPPWDRQGLLELFAGVFGPGIASSVAYAGHLAGRQPTADDVEPLSWLMWERAGQLPSQLSLLVAEQLKGFGRELIAWLQPYDAVLTPSLAERPPVIGTMNGALPEPEDTFRRSGRFTPYTAIANATGLPAISLPLRTGDDGIPTGVQLIGRPADEGTLLALSAQVERARPWADRIAAGATSTAASPRTSTD